MIHFIIVDDYKDFVEEIKSLVDKAMFNQPFEYEKHCFFDYNEEFYTADDHIKGLKIYILDIVTQSSSGLAAASFIRETDMTSMIIFLTAYATKGTEVLQHELMTLTFIVKDHKYEQRLLRALEKGVQGLKETPMLELQKRSTRYFIPYGDIIFIYRDKIRRKTVIVTNYKQFTSNQPLSFWEHQLTNYFIKSHRACLINPGKIYRIDKNKQQIIFNNGCKTNLVRRDFYVH